MAIVVSAEVTGITTVSSATVSATFATVAAYASSLSESASLIIAPAVAGMSSTAVAPAIVGGAIIGAGVGAVIYNVKRNKNIEDDK